MSRPEVSIKRVFTALNGRELSEMVLHDLKAQMESDMDFGEAVTYPIVEYVAEIHIRAYPWRTEKGVTKRFEGELNPAGLERDHEAVGDPVAQEAKVEENID